MYVCINEFTFVRLFSLSIIHIYTGFVSNEVSNEENRDFVLCNFPIEQYSSVWVNI